MSEENIKSTNSDIDVQVGKNKLNKRKKRILREGKIALFNIMMISVVIICGFVFLLFFKRDKISKEENRKLAEELKKEKAKLEKEKDEWSAKAEREAAGYIEEARKEADEILKEMRQKMETAKYHEVLTTRNRLKQMDEEATEELSAPVDENEEFEVGDAVELRSSSQVCEVISINRRDITILLNGREVRVKKNQIRHSARIIPKQKPQISVNVRNANIFATMSTECNLIGLRVEEGIEKMDDYMDEAMLHGLKHFRIIHGDGTGRLRKAVHQRLQKNPGVKEFRVGMPNEGGTGATIVTMK